MLYIDSKNINPYFNLATEEFLLKDKTDNIFMLWISEPSVIIGKHQNTLAEINYNYINQKKFFIARRLSGGGSVFHDKGNLNFTWILNGESGKLVDFKKFINPVIDYLSQYDLNATYGGRNDILIGNKKVSGNAEHVYKNRTLHHGTLLFNTNLEHLRSSLKTEIDKYKDKAVKSVPHSVANIKDFINNVIDLDSFRDNLKDYIKKIYGSQSDYIFSQEELLKIEELKKNKYETWDWNFGYSPEYIFTREIIINKIMISLKFKVVKGRISEVKIKNLKDVPLKKLIIKSLENCLHRENDIVNSLMSNITDKEIIEINVENFSENLF